MKRVPRGAFFFLSFSDVLFDSGTCVLMPGTLAIDWEKETMATHFIQEGGGTEETKTRQDYFTYDT